MSTATSAVHIAKLASQFPADLIGVTGENPILHWQVSAARSGLTQTAYQVQVSGSVTFDTLIADSGPVADSAQVGVVAPGGTLTSREIRHYRVRIQTEAGWTDWSRSIAIEAGLLSVDDFEAVAIGDESLATEAAPALRREINLKAKPIKARLYVSAIGIYEAYINGTKVGNDFLNPGWTTYQERILVHTYNVEQQLHAGDNALAALIGDGWHRGKFGFQNDYNNYGTKIALIAQLEVEYPDGTSETFATDESWKVGHAEVVDNSIYDGTTTDFTKAQLGWQQPGFDDGNWATPVLHPLDAHVLTPAITTPVREIHKFQLALQNQADRVLLRGTQNISGWVRLTVDGKKGQKVVIRHAEVLEPGDKLHTAALRSAKATDTYILGHDGRSVLEPKFTFHGFQHADVVTDATVVSAEAIAISSLSSCRGTFESSDTRLNRLHENVVWSQLDNFVSLPTDCPQRDERLGWTGDAQAFSGAANTLFDTESFWRSWLIDLALDQWDNGDVGAVIPDLLKIHAGRSIGPFIPEGRAGWADAATIVPMTDFMHFGDKQVLSQQIDSIRKWIMALHNRRMGAKFLPTEFQFGDWCDPDAPSDKPWESKVSADLVSNAFFANSIALAIETEKLVGDKVHQDEFQAMFDELSADFWERFGAEVTDTTAGSAISLEFGLVPEGEVERVAANLARMTKAEGGRISTGFLGTPLILHALSKNNHFDAAYQMLMRRGVPSWLYAVDMGATTMWERWDAIRADGSIHTGAMETEPEGQDDSSMISFNHYAYGAVVDWMYRNVAGINGENAGFEHFTVQPKPADGFTFANATIDTRYGEAAVNWLINDENVFDLNVKVPFGTRASLVLPVTTDSVTFVNGAAYAGEDLGYGEHRITVTNPSIVSF